MHQTYNSPEVSEDLLQFLQTECVKSDPAHLTKNGSPETGKNKSIVTLQNQIINFIFFNEF